MSAAAELLVLERRASLERLRASASRLAAHPAVALGIACVGLVATFAGMLASKSWKRSI